MKKIYSILIAIIFISSNIFAQSPGFTWAKQFAGTTGNTNNGQSTAVDGSGNVYSAGNLTGTIDFDPGPGVEIDLSTLRNGIYFLRVKNSNASVTKKIIKQ